MLAWLRRRFGSAPRGPERFDPGVPTPCECGCHRDPRITHYAPCCTACPKCGRLFRAGLAKHRKICQDERPVPGPRGLERFDDGEPATCDCFCHGNPGVQHYAACCRFCERCKRFFKGGFSKHACQGSSEPSPSSSAR